MLRYAMTVPRVSNNNLEILFPAECLVKVSETGGLAVIEITADMVEKLAEALANRVETDRLMQEAAEAKALDDLDLDRFDADARNSADLSAAF